MCLQFGFVIFWQKDFGAKAAHKMLVKLTLVYSMMPMVQIISFLCEIWTGRNRVGKRQEREKERTIKMD